MAIVTTDNKHYDNIAAAIREKTGAETTYKPEELPTGVDEVYEAGKQDGVQSAYDRFWDDYQQNGTRVTYIGAFNCGWSSETFWPKYDLLAQNSYNMFNNFEAKISLKQRLAECGVSMILDGNYNFSSMFHYAQFTEIGELDFSKSSRYNCLSVFESCTKLVTIEKITPPHGQTTFNWFYNCPALENVIFEGTIGANGLNLSWSPLLTHDSLMSIINALADYSEDTSGTAWAVTLGTTNLAKLTDAEKAIATQKGWTLA